MHVLKIHSKVYNFIHHQLVLIKTEGNELQFLIRNKQTVYSRIAFVFPHAFVADP